MPAMAVKIRLKLLRERLNQHEEVLDHLQKAPEHEALATIRRLRSTGNVSDTLARISGRAGSAVIPSDIDAARAIQPPTASRLEFELNVLHGLIYPPLEPLDLNSIDMELLFARSPRHRLTPRSLQCLSSGDSSGQITVASRVSAPYLLRRLPSNHTPPTNDEVPEYHYVDFRLTCLRVGYWTQIPIGDDLAARVLSHYLETDHPLWGCFDADLFLSDLVDHKLGACSPFFFHALMAHACVSCYF
jgi:hypothetical protein